MVWRAYKGGAVGRFPRAVSQAAHTQNNATITITVASIEDFATVSGLHGRKA